MMSNYRQVHGHTWKDSWFMELSAPHRLLFIYLFTNERAHMAGVYELPLRVMLFESGLEPDQVRQGLAYFERSERVYYERQTGDVFVRNLMRYNATNILTNKKNQSSLRRYRQLEGASLQYWARWDDAYPQVADRVFAAGEQEQEQQQEQAGPAAHVCPPVLRAADLAVLGGWVGARANASNLKA